MIVDKLSVYTVTNEFGGDTNKEAIIAVSSARQAEGNDSTVAINWCCGEFGWVCIKAKPIIADSKPKSTSDPSV